MELYITNDDQHLMSLYSDKMEEHNTKVSEHASKKDTYLYNYADSGFDLFIPKNDMEEDGSWVIGPFETRCISLKVKLRMTYVRYEDPSVYKRSINSCGSHTLISKSDIPTRSLPYCIYSRSSISKTPLMLANGVGIMDAGYRGECKVALKNISNSEYVIQPYTRLVQACRPDLGPFGVRIVNEEFDTTARGSGGFGSTGL